jgi:hypothetical protein
MLMHAPDLDAHVFLLRLLLPWLLHRSAAAQAEAKLKEVRASQAPVSMFNDGTQGGVEHENKVGGHVRLCCMLT